MSNLPQHRPITKDQAMALTERIRSAAEETWRLLLEAQETKAWEVLGYGSFAGYVEREFGMTDRNARHLIGQGEVIRELEAAAGVALPAGTVTGRAARQLKPVVDDLADRVAREVKGTRKAERAAKVAEIVDAARERLDAGTAVPVAPAPQDPPTATEPAAAPIPPPPPPAPAQAPAAPAKHPIDHLLDDVSPTGAARAAPWPVGQSRLKRLKSWTAQYEHALASAPAAPEKPPAPKGAAAKADCRHPAGRRIADTCMACGQQVKGR